MPVFALGGEATGNLQNRMIATWNTTPLLSTHLSSSFASRTIRPGAATKFSTRNHTCRAGPAPAVPKAPFAERYAEFIGIWGDGPDDLAAQHDHYASGAP